MASVSGKGILRCQVSVRKTSESEPLEEVLKGLDDVKTGNQ